MEPNSPTQETIATQPIQQPVVPQSPRPPLLPILAVTVLLTVVGTGAYYLGKNNSFTPNDSPVVVQLSPTVNPSNVVDEISVTQPSPAIDETVNWEKYTFRAVSLEFRLPPELSKNGRMVQEEYQGDTGSKITMRLAKIIEEPDYFFEIGGVTRDFSLGRHGSITDTTGFSIKNGKYYFKFINTENEMTADGAIITELTNQNGIKILKIKGKPVEDGGAPYAWQSAPNYVAALINTNSETYPGVAIYMHLTGNLTEKDFDQILSTFKFN
jgi:hypothetical protein